MTEPTTLPPPSETAEERKGRGPTRPEVKFADIVSDVRNREDVADIRAHIERGTTARMVREAVKVTRAEIKRLERSIADAESRADILARVEDLPPYLRKALVAVLTPEPVEGPAS